MKFSDTLITPRYAQQLLARNDGNRKIRQSMVNKYAAMMLSGQWVENGDVIRVGKTGRLLDGQHRLLAVVKSGAGIKCGLVTGVDEATFSTIDTGGARTTSDIVAMAGYADSNVTPGVASRLWRMLHALRSNAAAPPVYVLEVLDRWPEVEAAVRRQALARTARALLTPSVLACAYLYLNDIAAKPDLAEEFVTGMETGAGLESGNPILALRQRAIRMRAGRERVDLPVLWGCVVRALDAMELGQRLVVIKTATIDCFAVPDKLFEHLAGQPSDRLLRDLIPYATGGRAPSLNKLAAE